MRQFSRLLPRRVCSKLLRINWTSLELPQRATKSATGVRNSSSSCLPPLIPPKSVPCERPKIVEANCTFVKPPEWKGCDKICMPCCCPAITPPDCHEMLIRMNTCKKNEYRIPSYTECRKEPFDKIGPQYKKECCYDVQVGSVLTGVGGFEPLISTKVRQEMLLGRHQKHQSQTRHFSTSVAHLKSKKEDCKRQATLPCLKPVMVGGAVKATNMTDKKQCEKLCMPCCPPARDPPDCYFPYVRKECKRLRAPRPAFSECKKADIKAIRPCECQIPRLPPCNIQEKEESKGCN